jgi:hypothetical protein
MTGLARRDPRGTAIAQEVALETPADVEALLKRVALYLASAPQVEPRRALALNTVAARLLQAMDARLLQERLEEAQRGIGSLQEQNEQLQRKVEEYRRRACAFRKL